MKVVEVMSVLHFCPRPKDLYLGPCLSETPSMETSLAEMSTVILKLQNLCSQVQESKEEAISTLQQKM